MEFISVYRIRVMQTPCYCATLSWHSHGGGTVGGAYRRAETGVRVVPVAAGKCEHGASTWSASQIRGQATTGGGA